MTTYQILMDSYINKDWRTGRNLNVSMSTRGLSVTGGGVAAVLQQRQYSITIA